MRIGIPIAEFHRGNTGEYLLAAFQALGHASEILTPAEFSESFSIQGHDLYLCVDSGEPLNLFQTPFQAADLRNVGYWFIDYRHHHDGTTRTPGDLLTAQLLSERGGWVFQSQHEDFLHSRSKGVKRVSWLPLAADLDVWSDVPRSPKEFDLGFVGNIWDRGRASALEALLRAGDLRIAFPGHGAVWKEDGAALLRSCKIGFNISSWYGTEHAFDVNMRVFETLSCGVPLLTNEVPTLFDVIPKGAPFVRTYSSIDSLVETARASLADAEFLQSGLEARKWVESKATYSHRAEEILRSLIR